MENTIKLDTIIKFESEAFASVTQNPTLSYMDFVFTDDRPNGNKQGISKESFAGILNTGLLMPVKMSPGQISPGHKGTTPIGVISHLDTVLSDDKNLIIGKAALWSRERADDINKIKEAYAAGTPLNISWEVLYTETELDKDGVEWIKDPVVRAATLVGMPAYEGRTPVLGVAALDIEDDNKMDELEQVRTDLQSAQAQVTDLTDKLAEKDTELNSLKEFKASVEAKEAEAQLLNSRLQLFAESGINFKAEDIESKKASWLRLDDEAFGFLVSELKSNVKTAEAAVVSTPIPGSITTSVSKTPLEIVREGLMKLKESK